MTGRPRGQTAVRKGSGRRMAPSWSINPSATPPGQPEPPGERVSKETPPDPPQPPHAWAGGGGGGHQALPRGPEIPGWAPPQVPAFAATIFAVLRTQGPGKRRAAGGSPSARGSPTAGSPSWRLPWDQGMACRHGARASTPGMCSQKCWGEGGKHTRGWLLGVTPGSHLNHEWEELG